MHWRNTSAAVRPGLISITSIITDITAVTYGTVMWFGTSIVFIARQHSNAVA